jgi:hypothetical protein
MKKKIVFVASLLLLPNGDEILRFTASKDTVLSSVEETIKDYENNLKRK